MPADRRPEHTGLVHQSVQNALRIEVAKRSQNQTLELELRRTRVLVLGHWN